jgi:hypothetical protein
VQSVKYAGPAEGLVVALTGSREFVIRELRLAPAVFVREHAIEEPIPVLREIGSRWIENAYSIGLLNAGNDFPPESNGFLLRTSLTAHAEVSWRLTKKACAKNRPFLLADF